MNWKVVDDTIDKFKESLSEYRDEAEHMSDQELYQDPKQVTTDILLHLLISFDHDIGKEDLEYT